ncbi:ATP-dependent endonuclease [Mucilaginibacter limnophilus]|uniref:ATP-dependent endonuclease n=1 Tax=Mucilaginibacter limnophilus TaxID=1932778 RepID=A0A3S2WYQ7_9SPHI|nr:AAA family ATPase [Mucilaginibacter limnophilus]RVU01263.1 ATP-dependent endonuclease [Mucilaginibacter limnophilus]
MAKKQVVEEVTLESKDPAVPRPRLTKLIIKNFRCIGSTPVEIELNDIVVLVGGNNVGKSTILKAYELAMSQGSDKGKLRIDDFPNSFIDPSNLPEIEIQTIVYDNSPGEKWIATTEFGERLVREKFTWSEVNAKSKRQGWDVEVGAWSEQVPWGAPNVANSKRPEPHRVDAFDDPTKQAEEIKTLLKKVLEDKVRQHKGFEDEESQYRKLIKQVETLQKAIFDEAQVEITKINDELSSLISKVFPNYKVDFDPKSEEGLDKSIALFKGDAQLLMGPEDGYMSSIERQGSGARRTLLWSALKYISEMNEKRNDDGTPVRPHVLLLDEPEICLHPNAIREACNVLYNLPNNKHWQVMVTTHSPIFIDFSKDNTTIVKVERRTGDGAIIGTTVFRPDRLKLSDDDKLNLKLLNICDPYIAEFFFGGKTIIVEGDTEYTAFKYIIQRKPEAYKDIHIIRARGKATIVSLMKILNQFGSDYAILHDADSPFSINGNANPAWKINENILNELSLKPEGIKVRLLSSITNFELAYFDEAAKGEKPYNALRQLAENDAFFNTVEQLLLCLIKHDEVTPKNCLEWTTIKELEEACTAI